MARTRNFHPEDPKPGKVPEAVWAEGTILGLALANNDHFVEFAELEPDDFHLETHRNIFRCMKQLWNENVTIDTISLSNELRKKKQFDLIAGGMEYLEELQGNNSRKTLTKMQRGALAHMVKSLRDTRLKRQLINLSERIQNVVYDDNLPAETIAADFDEEILTLLSGSAQQKAAHIGDFTEDVFRQLMEQRVRKQEIIGLRTGFNDLDFSIGGLRPGENIVLAAWTGGGKSAFAMQVAAKNASQDIPVHIFSAEMTKEELLLRIAAGEAKINHLKLKFPCEMQEEDAEKLAATMTEIKRWPLWIDDSSSPDINQLVARGRAAAKKGAKLFIVDYLQLIHAKADSTRERVNAVSGGIRELAKITRVPVLNLSQLARPKEGGRREPSFFDLKESGNIEQDAHVIILLHREVGKTQTDFTGKDKIIIGKARSAPVGSLKAHYKGSVMRWYPRADDEEKKEEVKAPATAPKKEGGKEAASGEKEQCPPQEQPQANLPL